jgi:hypothetical protein
MGAWERGSVGAWERGRCGRMAAPHKATYFTDLYIPLAVFPFIPLFNSGSVVFTVTFCEVGR